MAGRMNHPTASETTSLLPSHDTVLGENRYKPKQNGKYLKLLAAIFLMALIIATVMMSFFSNGDAKEQEVKDDSSSSSTLSGSSSLQQQAPIDSSSSASTSTLSFDESTMELWDNWKASVSDWVDARIHRGEEDDNGTTNQFGEQVKSWWNDTQSSLSNGEKAGEQKFQDWWEHASDAEKSWWSNAQSSFSNSGKEAEKLERKFNDWWEHASEEEKAWWNDTQASLSNGEKAGKRDFRNWWKHASEAENKWWTSATKQLKHDRDVERTWWNAHRFGKRVKSWWNDTQASLSSGEKVEALERNFRDWWEHANKAERRWWNGTVKQLQYGRDVERTWWNSTIRKLKNDARVAEKIEQKWWDATKDELKRDKKVAVESEREWWNSTKKRMQYDIDVAEEKEREWWHAAKEQVQRDEAMAEKNLLLWLNMTAKSVKQGWNTTNQKEKQWWNATVHWFRQHVQNQYSDVDPSRMPLLYLNSSHAYSLLTSEYGWIDFASDFFLLQSGLDVQINQAYCAVASSAALLNSLRSTVSLPVDPLLDPYPYATQKNLLENECVQKRVIRHNDTYDGLLHAPGGLSLDQTKGLLECILADKSWEVTAVHVDPENVTVDDVRRDLEDALRHPFKRVIINYDRNSLGQDGGGHFSPVGSYSQVEDAFLIMDVAKYKYPPAWVPAKRLYNALASLDHCGDWDYPEGQERLHVDLLLHPRTPKDYRKAMKRLGCKATFRGYMIVSDAKPLEESF